MDENGGSSPSVGANIPTYCRKFGDTMKAVLIVLFLVNGEWQVLDGWHPLEIDAHMCEERVKALSKQLDVLAQVPYAVTCSKQQ